MDSRIIALLTDFGTADPFVGQVKGVLLSRAPRCIPVDLTHEIPFANITAAAFLLKASLPYFPKGTVFYAVVDPGTGSNQKALALEAGGYQFVGPDNGLFPAALEGWGMIRRAVSIENPKLRLQPFSPTFHGRDLFAPAAAALATGRPLKFLGPKVKSLRGGRLPAPKKFRDGWVGEVLWVDCYGNLITNIPSSMIQSTSVVSVGRWKINGISNHYAQGKPGQALAMAGAFGNLEISVDWGKADQRLNAKIGTTVFVR